LFLEAQALEYGQAPRSKRVDSERVEENERAEWAAASDSPTEPFAAGEVFAGRYPMIGCLGQGGMGDVWRADDLVLEMPVALS